MLSRGGDATDNDDDTTALVKGQNLVWQHFIENSSVSAGVMNFQICALHLNVIIMFSSLLVIISLHTAEAHVYLVGRAGFQL